MIISNSSLSIYCECLDMASVNLMVKSFVRDLTDKFVKPNIVSNKESADIVLGIKKMNHDEEYLIDIKKDQIHISGGSDLGLIFGVYTFEEEFLKIPPFFLIEDLKLEKEESLLLEEKTISSYPKTKFRGCFINDEDLLSTFKTKDKRNIDYDYYKGVINFEMMDIIAETMLRYKMNLIIPSTLIDLENPAEEKLVDICSKRGLYISQHHIEPLGVSKFSFSKFANKTGYSDAFSYVSNKKALIECWKHYLIKWSKYPRVIFQTGLRGGLDRPVWVADKDAPTSSSERGKLISEAIEKQHELVNEIYPFEKHFSTTLWMEGADLFNDNSLKISDDIIICFSDVGMSQLFGKDFFDIPREKNKSYGIYYHAAYWHTGPHLAEALLPEKMVYCYKLIDQKNTNKYSMLNVANIKEFTFSIYVNSKLTWNVDSDLNEIFDQYCGLFFDGKNRNIFKDAIRTYFSSLFEVNEIEYKKFCDKYNFSYYKYKDIDFPVININDGIVASLIKNFTFENRLAFINPSYTSKCLESFKTINEALEKFNYLFDAAVSKNYRNGFYSHWILQSSLWKMLFSIGPKYIEGIEEVTKNNKEKAINLFNDCIKLINEFLVLSQSIKGEYKDWYKGDTKTNIPLLIKCIEAEINNLKM